MGSTNTRLLHARIVCYRHSPSPVRSREYQIIVNRSKAQTLGSGCSSRWTFLGIFSLHISDIHGISCAVLLHAVLRSICSRCKSKSSFIYLDSISGSFSSGTTLCSSCSQLLRRHGCMDRLCINLWNHLLFLDWRQLLLGICGILCILWYVFSGCLSFLTSIRSIFWAARSSCTKYLPCCLSRHESSWNTTRYGTEYQFNCQSAGTTCCWSYFESNRIQWEGFHWCTALHRSIDEFWMCTGRVPLVFVDQEKECKILGVKR